MGAKPSSEAPAEDAFVDYYELLEVEQTDTEDVIRKSYRRLALRLHPDKNIGREEEAKKKFIKLQEAYDVLSDAQERAWYDQNRERLIHGLEEDEGDEDVDAKFQFFKSGGAAPPAASMAAGIGVPHLLRFYAPSMAKDFSDSNTSFYGTYRRLFERLAEEDRVAAAYPGESHTAQMAEAWRDHASSYPSFGGPEMEYVPSSSSAPSVKEFYQFWMQFSSRKSFAWKDKHDLRDAPDRRVRRLLEKDNKRARDVARREYNDAIRGLAAFIRRRDPRYKAYQAQQSSAEAQEAAAAEAEQRRKAAQEEHLRAKRDQAASFQAQGWQQTTVREEEEVHDFSSGDSLDDVDDEDEEPMWDCVACNKRFQSQAAWDNHERSKKHKKEVERLKREMLEEDDMLGDDDDMLAEEAAELNLDDMDDTMADVTSRKKDKRRKKQEKKMQDALATGASVDVSPALANSAQATPKPAMPENDTLATILPHLAAMPVHPERPPGSFDVFGYGSLIFKPPPHTIGYTPGYIKGYVRRFAQDSHDHRGTPERPGRVVTLVESSYWHSLPGADAAPEGDIVWGVSYVIDPEYADEVRAYLDHREKNGYTPHWEPIYDRPDAHTEPTVMVPKALVYVGLPGNQAFGGPMPLDQLAAHIYESKGPSGRNDEYLLKLAEAVRVLTPHSEDAHLFTLERYVQELAKADQQIASSADAVTDKAPDAPTETSGASMKKKPRRKAKAKPPPGTEVCHVCRATFPSRTKLFAHVRDKGHAQAAPGRRAT